MAGIVLSDTTPDEADIRQIYIENPPKLSCKGEKNNKSQIPIEK